LPSRYVADRNIRAIKPGGWIELQDIRLFAECDDDTMPADYGLSQFFAKLAEGFGAFGFDLAGMLRNATMVKDGGFVNVEERVWKIPIGTWPKDRNMKTIGLYNRCIINDALQGVILAPLTRGLKWSAIETEIFLTGVRRSLTNSSVHSYYTFHDVYGQKPMDCS
jgi:hypothetical protein